MALCVWNVLVHVLILVTVAVADTNPWAPKSWSHRMFSELKLSFLQGGCTTPKTKESCQILSNSMDLLHLDGYFDATSLYKGSNAWETRGEIVLVKTDESKVENGCPELIPLVGDNSPHANKVYLITDEQLGFLPDQCSISMLSAKSKQSGAVGLLLALPQCLRKANETFAESGMEELRQECEDLKTSNYSLTLRSHAEAFVKMYESQSTEIPIMLLTRYDALRLQECIQGEANLTLTKCDSGTSIAATLKWNAFANHVDFDIFDHVYYAETPFYLEDQFYKTLLPSLIKNGIQVKHIMILQYGCNKNDNKNDCDDQCIRTTNKYFCAVAQPEASQAGISRLELIREGLRRDCLFKCATTHSTKLKYWQYLRNFYRMCQLRKRFNEACSIEAMEFVGLVGLDKRCSYENMHKVRLHMLNGIMEHIEDNEVGGSFILENTVIMNDKLVYREQNLDSPAPYQQILGTMCHNLGNNTLKGQCMCRDRVADPDKYHQCVVEVQPDDFSEDFVKEPQNTTDTWIYSLLLIMIVVVVLFIFMTIRERRIKEQMKEEFEEILEQKLFDQNGQSASAQARDLLRPIIPSDKGKDNSREVELT